MKKDGTNKKWEDVGRRNGRTGELQRKGMTDRDTGSEGRCLGGASHLERFTNLILVVGGAIVAAGNCEARLEISVASIYFAMSLCCP